MEIGDWGRKRLIALGYGQEAASAALQWVEIRLAAHSLVRGRYYLFRSGAGGAAGGGAAGTGGRPRLLLAFPSPDAALGFAQAQQMGAAPRLLGLSLVQLLAVLAERPAIQAIHVAGEEPAAAGRLPSGVRITRDELLLRLRGEGSDKLV